MANGPWFEAPAMRGPFDSAQSGSARTGMLVHTRLVTGNEQAAFPYSYKIK